MTSIITSLLIDTGLAYLLRQRGAPDSGAHSPQPTLRPNSSVPVVVSTCSSPPSACPEGETMSSNVHSNCSAVPPRAVCTLNCSTKPNAGSVILMELRSQSVPNSNSQTSSSGSVNTVASSPNSAHPNSSKISQRRSKIQSLMYTLQVLLSSWHRTRAAALLKRLLDKMVRLVRLLKRLLDVPRVKRLLRLVCQAFGPRVMSTIGPTWVNCPITGA